MRSLFHFLQTCLIIAYFILLGNTWIVNKNRELIAVKVLRNSLLNTAVVAFQVFHYGTYAPMLVPNPPFKKILKLVLWNGIQSCRCITPGVNIIKIPPFEYSLYLREQRKVIGGYIRELGRVFQHSYLISS